MEELTSEANARLNNIKNLTLPQEKRFLLAPLIHISGRMVTYENLIR